MKSLRERFRLKRPGPWLQMTMALVGLCGTLVLLADMFFGVLPDPALQQRQWRQQLAEGMAVHVTVLLQADNPARLKHTLDALVDQTPEVHSLAVRRADSSMVAHAMRAAPATTPGQRTAGAPLPQRALEKVAVPLLTNAGTWGSVELSFVADRRPLWLAFVRQPLVSTLLFISVAGSLVFALYLRRVLQHLDPAAAIPERVQNAFDVMAEGVAVLDDRGRVLLLNKAFGRLHPLAAQVTTGTALSALPWLAQGLGTDEREHPWVRTIAERAPLSNLPLVVAAGTEAERQLMVNCTPITDAGGKLRGCMATFDDVSALHRTNEALRDAVQALNMSNEEVQRQNAELERLATRDPLTGCLNRRALLSGFEQLLAQARSSGKPLACLMLDIDHFKSVNDRFGHAVGDRVIQEVARRMQAVASNADLVGRYGGEEFCMVMPGLTQVGAAQVAERLRRRIELECAAAVPEVTGLTVTASLGVEAFGVRAPTPAQMLDRADQALYQAKRGGRNRVALFNDTQQAQESGA